MKRNLRLGHATLTIGRYGKTRRFYLDALKVTKGQEGKGHASKALRRLTNWADQTERILSLIAYPFGSFTLSKDELVAFYSRHGFEKTKGQPYGAAVLMIRYPVASNIGNKV